jgi:hypothetical protein
MLRAAALALFLAAPLVAPHVLAQEQEPPTPAPAPAPAVEPAAAPERGTIPPGTAPEAESLWRAMLAAVGVVGATPEASLPPVTQFDVNLGLLTRSGRRGFNAKAETHEFKTRVLYMAPWFVRYRLSETVETGFGPDGYWLRDKDEIVSLQGRDYATDREQVARVHSLCRNFLSIAAPDQLRLDALERVARLPFQEEILPRRPGLDYKRLAWLRIVTPDFQLVEEIQPKTSATGGIESGTRYQVYFGLEADTHLPRCLHVVRVGARPEDLVFEQLILIENWNATTPEEGPVVRLPQRLFVHERLPSHPLYDQFLLDPDREIYVLEGSTLHPDLSEASFDPKL